MGTKKTDPQLPLGARVKILKSGIKRGKIVELCGPLAPGGVQVYRVLVRGKPRPAYIELREDQLELIQTDT